MAFDIRCVDLVIGDTDSLPIDSVKLSVDKSFESHWFIELLISISTIYCNFRSFCLGPVAEPDATGVQVSPNAFCGVSEPFSPIFFTTPRSFECANGRRKLIMLTELKSRFAMYFPRSIMGVCVFFSFRTLLRFGSDLKNVLILCLLNGFSVLFLGDVISISTFSFVSLIEINPLAAILGSMDKLDGFGSVASSVVALLGVWIFSVFGLFIRDS